MKRRLNFLFPDELHARHAIDNMWDGIGIDARHIHAVGGSEGAVARLPHPSAGQRTNLAGRLENLIWNGNLALFGVALVVFLVALASGNGLWTLLGLAVMVATFVAGLLFTTQVPHVHLDEFQDALAHGEILVMLDVPSKRVKEVEDYIHHRHPEAIGIGTSWSVDAFGL